jgi:hypothetical protein
MPGPDKILILVVGIELIFSDFEIRKFTNFGVTAENFQFLVG